jgi:hypothetical protein
MFYFGSKQTNNTGHFVNSSGPLKWPTKKKYVKLVKDKK